MIVLTCKYFLHYIVMWIVILDSHITPIIPGNTDLSIITLTLFPTIFKLTVVWYLHLVTVRAFKNTAFVSPSGGGE